MRLNENRLPLILSLFLVAVAVGCDRVGGVEDAGTAPDAGLSHDDGGTPTDGGAPEEDAGMPDGGSLDAGEPPAPLEKTGTFHRRKKLIQWGWDTPSAAYVRANLATMEAMPFDGITLFPGKATSNRSESLVTMFDPELWDDTRLDEESVVALRPSRFTDNFLMLYTFDGDLISYWDDEAWARITANMKRLAELARKGGLPGIFWDSEDYGLSPWELARKAEGRTKEELAAQMRLRGQQVMRAWQEGYPEIKILTSILLYASYRGMSPAFEMQPHFINGMLDVMEPGVTLIEGHELVYYWTTTEQWFGGFRNVREAYRDTLIDPANWAKYDAQVQVGTSTYADYSDALSPEERSRHEHHVYMGLALTDEYQFYFHEQFAFWPNSDNPLALPIQSQTPYPGILDGLQKARGLIESGQRLGYDLQSGSVRTGVVVEIAEPAHKDVRPSTFTVSVQAENANRVRLYRNGMLFEEREAHPFEFTLSDLEPGPHGLIARARHAGTGEWGTSGAIIVDVE